MNQRHAPGSPARDFTLETLVESLSAWHADHAIEAADSLQQAVHQRVGAETQALTSLIAAAEDCQRLRALSRWLDENLARLHPCSRRARPMSSRAAGPASSMTAACWTRDAW